MSSSPVRHIGLHHIAFFRSAFESDLTLQDIAGRYLETGKDIPAAKRTLKFIQSALCQAARRHGKHGAAALLRVPKKRFQEQALPEANLPSLEEYRLTIDPDGFYGEQELLEIYQAEHSSAALVAETPGETRKRERNLRLLRKKIDLINDLFVEIREDPKMEDLVEGWFDHRVAAKFAGSPIKTLGDLILFMNHRGYRWYRVVPKLGEVTAKRILAFIADSNLSGALSLYAMVPIDDFKAQRLGAVAVPSQTMATPGTGITPLENIQQLASELDGSRGTNRCELSHNKLRARNDLEAINAWLVRYSGNTERAYRKEAERLLLWAVHAKRLAFSSLTTEDITDYVAFLEDPQPKTTWVADKRYSRFHPAWRPFVQSGLKPRSIAYALLVLSALCGWLVGQRYLDSNPFEGLPRSQETRWRPLSRSFSRKQWGMIQSHLKDQLDDLAGIRMRFLVDLAYSTGLRIHELAKARTSEIIIYEFSSDPVWYLKVVGKGRKEREVPLASAIVSLMRDYMQMRGEDFEAIRTKEADRPLIASLENSAEGVATRTIDHMMHNLFQAVADEIEGSDRLAAIGLRKASTHWLRHTHATQALQNGVPLGSVRENLGHASVGTTSIYMHTELADRHKEIEAFVGSL